MKRSSLASGKRQASAQEELEKVRELSLPEKSLTAITDDDLERRGIKTQKKMQTARRGYAKSAPGAGLSREAARVDNRRGFGLAS